MFGGYMALNPHGSAEDDPSRIVVDRPALLEFLQFRTKAFEPERANALLDAMGPRELDSLIRDYAREEALYREATALGLDKSDYVIKRRLVQTVEFVAGNASAPLTVNDAGLNNYFAAHKDRYAEPATITFTHVFFDAGQGRDVASGRAAKALAAMNGRQVAFADAPGWGDRFAYNLNYVDRPMDAVAGHFGDNFTQQLFALKAEPERWQGPLESAYGFHLVMVTARKDLVFPPLEEIKDRVREDYMADLATERRDELIDDMLKHYEVEVTLDRRGAVKAAAR